MFKMSVQFAEASGPTSGIGAFNINLKSFLFQLVTFVLVVLVFKRWVLPPILKTMQERQNTLERSLEQAKQTEEALSRAEVKAEEIIAKARTHADEAMAQARKSAEEFIVSAETAAAQRATLIIKDAQGRLDSERAKLRNELKTELADLVADATEIIIRQKLDQPNDRKLVEQALKEIG